MIFISDILDLVCDKVDKGEKVGPLKGVEDPYW